ncbi:MAG: Trp biosynthesis-associated membrane protein [Pontimonas sp.]
MSRLRHYFAALGLVSGLVALGLPWLTFELTTGLAGSVGWGDVSPGSVSVVFAAAAGWGLTLMLSPRPRRVVGSLIGLLGLSAGILAVLSLASGTQAVLSQAEAASGVLGVFSLDDIAWSWNPVGIACAGTAIVSFCLSGLATMAWPGLARQKDPYQLTPSDPWDELSQGSDPTAR